MRVTISPPLLDVTDLPISPEPLNTWFPFFAAFSREREASPDKPCPFSDIDIMRLVASLEHNLTHELSVRFTEDTFGSGIVQGLQSPGSELAIGVPHMELSLTQDIDNYIYNRSLKRFTNTLYHNERPRRRGSTVGAAHGDTVRQKAGRFRVLIIGRANSGKTTILKKVCNSAEEPVIYSGNRVSKIGLNILQPSRSRGHHDIKEEITFTSNSRFIFHDSCGFEAGNTAELSDVKNFIVQRAKERRLRNRVHAIWYCIPLNDNRPVTKAEDTFFSECGTGHVPVIVLFTKLDTLDTEGYQMLLKKNPDISHDDAAEQAPGRAQELFDEMLPKLSPIFESRYPPKHHVVLRDMNLPETNCHQLLQVTAAALDDETLQLLFVATQQANLEMCTTHAIGKLLSRMETAKRLSKKEIESIILRWYPHILKLATLTGSTESLVGYQIVQLGASLAIVAEHSFFVKQEKQQVSFKQSIEIALDAYLDSTSFAATMSAIEAMDFAVLGKQKSFFAPPRRDEVHEKAAAQSQLHELHKSLVKIVLKNRITRLPEEEILM
ncbi:hypothetical protein DXG01_000606 [Tephrocybe rancida]|nr:hypothetical protein DXG01_000606 [Tephrocybe rancida]